MSDLEKRAHDLLVIIEQKASNMDEAIQAIVAALQQAQGESTECSDCLNDGCFCNTCNPEPQGLDAAVDAFNDIYDGVSHNLRDALLAAAPHLRGQVPEGWRTMESAPKDGTKVLVYVPGDSLYPTAAKFDTKERFLADYGDPDYMEEGWRWCCGYPSDFHEELIAPTHWMPLPAAPAAPVQEKGRSNG